MKELLTVRSIRTATAIGLAAIAFSGCGGNNHSSESKGIYPPVPNLSEAEQARQDKQHAAYAKVERAEQLKTTKHAQLIVRHGLKDYLSTEGKERYLVIEACNHSTERTGEEFRSDLNNAIISASFNEYYQIAKEHQPENQMLGNNHLRQTIDDEFEYKMHDECGTALSSKG